MNISEKIQKIVDDMPKVYDAGYVKGQESMVDENKIIEKTVSGTGLLLIDDVSEVPHEVEIQLTSDTITDFSNTEVVVRGKNLWDKEYASDKNNWRFLNNSYSSIPIYVGKGNVVTLSYKNPLATGLSFYFAAMTKNSLADAVTTWMYHSTVPDVIHNPATIRATEDYIYVAATMNLTGLPKIMEYIGNDLQIEIGSEATEYVSYEGRTYISDSNGKVVVKSISPIMNISTNETDINISANYYKSYGMQLQYDKLWDAIQLKGTRTTYDSAFIGSSWNDEVFKPKYDIRPVTAKSMFRFMKVTNLKGSLESAGVVLDTSACTDFEMTFYYGTYGHIPEIDTRSATTLYSIFCGADAHTIDKWILKDDGSQKFNTNTFTHNSLKNLVVEGVIGQNLLSFALCTNLTHDSLLSILNALKDYSDYTGSTTWKITLGSQNIAKLTDEDKEIASSKGWVIA